MVSLLLVWCNVDMTVTLTDVSVFSRFGLGRVYQKTGRLKLAEYHFRRALAINPSNIVLYCCVGTVSRVSPICLIGITQLITCLAASQVVEKRGDLKGALQVFERALSIDPKNKMSRFRKGRVLMGLRRYQVRRFLIFLSDLRCSSCDICNRKHSLYCWTWPERRPTKLQSYSSWEDCMVY